ncbi:hypothetical protein IAD21_02087 [Abditibacteriota bacterium]|nr:hypothetical protein IAD21_02087 [Abditibacteriota bacterium]
MLFSPQDDKIGSNFRAMKTQLKPLILAGALILSVPYIGHAQETLGGLGAAGAAGATLGAAGAGSLSSGRMTRGVGSSGGANMGDTPDAMGGDPRSGGSPGGSDALGADGAAAAPVKLTPPRLQSFNDRSGDEYVRELLAASPKPLPAPQSRQRSPRGQARYSARVSKQTKAQRSREIQSKYKIPGIGWEAAYLPQDRYKMGKIWRFVSTEDDRYYYTPSAMARKRFSPNRVIGFNSFQDALAAGYRPDPVSQPAPGAQITSLARLYRGKELYTFVEYVYSGQVAPESFLAVYNYAMTVDRTLRPTRARPYIGDTVAKVLDAALTGDASSIPLKFNSQGPVLPPPPVATGTEGGSMEGSSDPRMSGGSGDPRMGGGSSDPRMMGGSGSSERR